MKYLHGVLFNALCPNSSYKPEEAVEKVTQIFKDKATGNMVRLPMNAYMGNFQTAMACLEEYPYDMVGQAMRNMDPAVKEKLVKSYKAHREQRSLDPFTQTKAILDLAAVAEISKEELQVNGKN